MTREAHRKASTGSLEYAYVDSADYQSEAKASREMARELRSNLEVDKRIPRAGLGASDYRDITWEMLEDNGADVFVVILDEVDKLEDDELLWSLSRAKESGKLDTHIGIICISNKIEYRERLNERTDSSLQDNELVFDPYDADQLRAILEKRRDAFKEDVLSDEVIPLIEALSAQEHGDARKAVDTFYEAGKLAEKEDASQVTEDHVREAINRAEVNRFRKLISGQTPHVKYILQALAMLTDSEPGNEFRTAEIYDVYEKIAQKEGLDPLTYDRVSRLLKEQSFLGITESEHTGGGLGQGSYLEHRLIRDPEIVLDAVTERKDGG